MAHYNSGQYPAAIADFTEAIRNNATNPEGFLLRAFSYRMAGQAKKAWKDIQAAIKLDPSSLRLRLQAAQLLLELGDHRKALKEAQCARKLAPHSAQAWRLEADILIASGGTENALKALRQASDISVEDSGLHVRVGRILWDQGKWKEALEEARRALELEPQSHQASKLELDCRIASWQAQSPAARILALRDRFPEVEALFDRLSLLQSDFAGVPDDLSGFLNDMKESALSLLQDNRSREAEGILKKVIALWMRYCEALSEWARKTQAEGRGDEAMQAYGQCGNFWLGQLESFSYLSEILLINNKPQEAFRLLEMAKEKSPPPDVAGVRGWLVRYRLAVCMLDYVEAARIGDIILDKTRSYSVLEGMRGPFFPYQNDRGGSSGKSRIQFFKQALKRLNRFIVAHPDIPWGYYFRIFCSKKAGSSFNQIDMLRLRKFSAKRYGWMRNEVGLFKLELGDFPEAHQNFAVAARCPEPGDWRSQCYIGEILACRGNIAEAMKSFAKAESLAPKSNFGSVRVWKAEILLWIGQYANALDILNETLATGPAYALGWKGAALVMLKRYPEALDVLEDAVSAVPWDIEARIWRAEAFYRLRRCRDALKELERVSIFRRAPIKNCYFYILRGLVRGGKGDLKGMREDIESIPDHMIKAGLKGLRINAIRNNDDAQELLETILRLSKGVRRGGHEAFAWLPRAAS